MEQRLKKYLEKIETKLNDLKVRKNTLSHGQVETEKKELLTQIQFFQHERLIHLMVTFLFAIITIITFVAVLLTLSIWAVALLTLLLVLLIPYIRHYYILENGTQKLYRYYDKLEGIIREEKKLVAFTFDDGPVTWNEESSAMSILHTLHKYKQRATFFYVGQNINEENKQEILYAKSIGCEIGNHGFSHSPFPEMSENEMKEEVSKTSEKLLEITGESSFLTRLPYLSYDEKVLMNIDSPIISCSVDSRDWDKATTEEMIATIMDAAESGALNNSIVLMHEPYMTTASAVEYLVPALIKEGYQIVTVSELAGMREMTLKKHHVYSRM